MFIEQAESESLKGGDEGVLPDALGDIGDAVHLLRLGRPPAPGQLVGGMLELARLIQELSPSSGDS